MKSILFSLIFICSTAFAGANTNNLPLIKDAAILCKDCISLYQQFSPATTNDSFSHYWGREIPKEKWPASIQALRPFMVTRDKYAICIWILHDPKEPEQIWDSRGYYVHGDSHLSPPRIAHGGGGNFNLYRTDYDGIDIFFFPGAVL
jgi:hypothetical protein